MTPSTETNVTPAERSVLDYFGLEASDLPGLARSVDIDALARSIEDPTKTAVCNIVDGDGKIVTNDEGPVRVHVEAKFKDFLKTLAKKSMRFIEWF